MEGLGAEFGFPARKEGGRVVKAQLIFNSTVPDSL